MFRPTSRYRPHRRGKSLTSVKFDFIRCIFEQCCIICKKSDKLWFRVTDRGSVRVGRDCRAIVSCRRVWGRWWPVGRSRARRCTWALMPSSASNAVTLATVVPTSMFSATVTSYELYSNTGPLSLASVTVTFTSTDPDLGGDPPSYATTLTS